MRGELAAVALLIALPGLSGCAEGDGPRTAVVTVQHSAYLPSSLTVRAGQQLVLELRNDDPIDHEWIVGDEAVHARHREGTEPAHDERPTEVTVPARSTRTTTVVFDTPGTYRFVCHLPGHEVYGMTGVLTVLAA
ncbi:MAG TPA: cupredoxin domain-containing protein [Mycobacteriales bacterium]|nr:cupredoxin domain-containing protein [Mycobacteriales bacterium]